MPTMAVMTGIQASGKSTFCQNELSGYVRINLDILHTRNKENIAMEEAFGAGRDMVIDNTNPTAEDRKKYIEKAKQYGSGLSAIRCQETIMRTEDGEAGTCRH